MFPSDPLDCLYPLGGNCCGTFSNNARSSCAERLRHKAQKIDADSDGMVAVLSDDDYQGIAESLFKSSGDVL